MYKQTKIVASIKTSPYLVRVIEVVGMQAVHMYMLSVTKQSNKVIYRVAFFCRLCVYVCKSSSQVAMAFVWYVQCLKFVKS